jgi:hypothetical protein
VSETHPGKEQAMLEFVRLLDAICPTFRNHVNEKMILHNDKTLKRSPSLKEDVLDRYIFYLAQIEKIGIKILNFQIVLLLVPISRHKYCK